MVHTQQTQDTQKQHSYVYTQENQNIRPKNDINTIITRDTKKVEKTKSSHEMADENRGLTLAVQKKIIKQYRR